MAPRGAARSVPAPYAADRVTRMPHRPRSAAVWQRIDRAAVRLLGPAEIRALAAELDLRPTKQRGQNFVIDPNTVRRIVRESGIGADDVVIEVGPGPGLADPGPARGRRSTSSRSRSTAVLGRQRFPPPRGHAPVRPSGSRSSPPTRCASIELPGPAADRSRGQPALQRLRACLLHLLSLLPSLERGLVMVQAEVADRLAAAPGSKTYGVPSVKAAWYADVRRAGAVGRNVFWPAPNVDSGLVALDAPRPARHHGDPGAGLRGGRRCLRPAAQDAPRGAARARRLDRGATGGPGARRASTRWHAARCSRRRLRPDRRGAVPDEPPGIDGPRARRRSTSTSAWVARARTASTRSTPSIRPSGSTTTSRASEAAGWSVAVATADYIDAGAVPPRVDNIVTAPPRLLASPRGRAVRRHDPDRQGHPDRRWHGRRVGRRRGGAGRARPALGLETSDDDLFAAGRRARQRRPFALVGGTAHGTGPRRARRARRRRRAAGGGSRCRPREGCPRRPSTATSTGCSPTPRRAGTG